MRVLDAAEHVGRTTAPILFRFGRQDELPARWFQTYVDAAPPARRVEWYDAGHALCECATRDRKALAARAARLTRSAVDSWP